MKIVASDSTWKIEKQEEWSSKPVWAEGALTTADKCCPDTGWVAASGHFLAQFLIPTYHCAKRLGVTY